jgi:DHA1 family bicyclomycin/chloramphenicol resistance-like MFS transporter
LPGGNARFVRNRYARVSLSWALILGLLRHRPAVHRFLSARAAGITQQLQATSTQTQLSLTAALIGLGLGQLFFGPLSDRIGRLKPLALSCCCLSSLRRCAP